MHKTDVSEGPVNLGKRNHQMLAWIKWGSKFKGQTTCVQRMSGFVLIYKFQWRLELQIENHEFLNLNLACIINFSASYKTPESYLGNSISKCA